MLGEFKKFSIGHLVGYYRRRLKNVRYELEKKPSDWGKYQNEFNKEMNHLFSQIIMFEKRCLKNNKIVELNRVKEFFIKRLRKYFYFGDLPKWSVDKPYGYAGDFKIINDIYMNDPKTTGYDRLFDNYFLTSAISIAVRNRKNDFKREILSFVRTKYVKDKLKIMNLASGCALEIKELLTENPEIKNRVHFDCYDFSEDAHAYAKKLLEGHKNISFITHNALRIAAAREIGDEISQKYDFIYSMGLFDYLNYKISVKLIKNLKELLDDKGMLFIADVRDRYLNPSVFNMEWACAWELIYRDDKDFRQIFLDAGFKDKNISVTHEQQGIIQYIKAAR